MGKTQCTNDEHNIPCAHVCAHSLCTCAHVHRHVPNAPYLLGVYMLYWSVSFRFSLKVESAAEHTPLTQKAAKWANTVCAAPHLA